MRTIIWQLLPISSAVLIGQLVGSVVAKAEAIPGNLQASEAIAPLADPSELPAANPWLEPMEEQADPNGMDQLNSVTQLSDVYPTDWAYEALRSLVEKYQCIAGYPDGTYRGNRAMTRYEFAAGVNSCMESILRLAGGLDTSKLATKEDLAILQRLIDEFAVELATLRGRVDVLEARTTQLESDQFSTTTKLSGEVSFSANDIIGDIDTGGRNSVPHFSERAFFNLNTSFSGKDHLLVRLYASNSPNLGTAAGTNMARLLPDRGNNNTFDIDLGWYNFPIGKNGNVLIEYAGGKLDDFAPSLNALDYGGAARGTISQFGQRNAIYRLSGAGAGAGINYNFGKAVGVSLGYLAGNYLSAADSTPGRGFFNGTFGAIGQLTVRPTDNISLGATYVRSYFTGEDIANNNTTLGGGVGSALAEKPFGDVATSADSYGLEASWRLSPRFIIGGWGGWTKAQAETGPNTDADATVVNWAVTLAFPDLGKEGNLGGIVVGMPPKLTDNDISGREDKDSSLHLEAFYRYQITDNIGITPGLMVILNPEHNNDNRTMYVGTIRTTFSF